MAKYLRVNPDGNIEEVQAISSSAGPSDAAKILETNGDGEVDETFLPSSAGGTQTIVAVATEALAAGDLINLWDNAGTLEARLASSVDQTKPCHGFVKDAVAMGSNATVYLIDILSATGLTVGSKYFLDASTPGGMVTTPPTTAGNILQIVGTAIAPDQFKFRPEQDFVIRG